MMVTSYKSSKVKLRAVDRVFQKIQADPRHKQISALIRRDITKRDFGDWKMGFVNVSNLSPQEREGYSDFLQNPMTPATLSDDPSFAQVFLDTFRGFLR